MKKQMSTSNTNRIFLFVLTLFFVSTPLSVYAVLPESVFGKTGLSGILRAEKVNPTTVDVLFTIISG